MLSLANEAGVHVLSIGADGAIPEFNAQEMMMSNPVGHHAVSNWITFRDADYQINFKCPVVPGVGPLVRVQDPKHAKKTGRNAIFSGARLLTFGNATVRYDQILALALQEGSTLYRRDVLNVDKQDDGAAYRIFSSSFLKEVVQSSLSDRTGLFVFLYIIGKDLMLMLR
jgi:hypothetical protein